MTQTSTNTDPAVLTEIRDGVGVVTLNRPEVRNAVNSAIAVGVAAAMDHFDARDDVRVIVITGTGNTFCSGMDLKAFLAGEIPALPGRGLAGLTEAPPAKPLIAAVEGYALAGGFEIALACDLLVAAENAAFGLPEVKRGLVAAGGGLLRLPRRIPYQVALEAAFTGDPIDARRAHALGLVNRLAEPGQALVEALRLADAIAANGPLAVRVTKQILSEAPDWSRDEMWHRQEKLSGPVFVSADAREGAAAFAEKRVPKWTGR
ncbi:crotonase/enoyl-CoA hydratase family protein [Actinocrispum sp. NPDC049592]|uniref:crotonase/enoyl-CoA hydratase family protein n=1 Tax=Actinocrispum sp. NPDC049592 TaxID=3154835 RepID=UPI00343018EC